MLFNSGTEAEERVSFNIFFFLAADEEQQQNVAAAAAAGARPRPQEEQRAEGMPRRRRNMGTRLMAQRRAQQAEQGSLEEVVPKGSHQEERNELPEFQVSGKIGAKKQRKLEEKQARRAQREVRISCHVLSREEEKRKAKEEEEKREYEEYLKLKESFVVEEEGVEESMTEEQVCEAGSAVLLLDLGASHCSLCPAGVIDDRGKFIYITAEEMAAVAQYIKQRGRVSIAELAQASNSLINLQPDSRAVAPTLA
uniref:DDRGK domain containing 1 n=1 Tax=Serinus canaria TaxID=9135 RepID=A0A8C9N7V0_SERCA